MPFDQEKWHSPAVRGEVGGAVLDVSRTASVLLRALGKLAAASGVDLSAELNELSKIDDDTWKRFIALTGWHDK